ncbi:MAG: hypothetical protein MUO58_18605 [Anaerolineales bacterium]|nr:hypothetical protein [Anaerolineales bacterium]
MVIKRDWFSHITLSMSIGLMVFVLAGCENPTGTNPQPSLEGVSSTAPVQLTEISAKHTPAETEDGGGPTVTPSSSSDQVSGPEEVERSTPAPTATFDPSKWQNLPVIPLVSDGAREIYKNGLSLGNNPRAFAKVGDCQNVPSMFLSIFDHEGFYSFREEDAQLEDLVEWFEGSFSRESEAVRRGFNAASVVSPLWANPDSRDPGETPLDCEIRLQQPSIALVSLETWWAGDPNNYEKYVREILETLIDHGTLPILATKADNLEEDHRINMILARLAYEYDIPLWNFWRAIQPLPNHGLMEDGFHLTFAENHFDDPEAMRAAWPWRNLTALQALNSVWQGVTTP